MKWLRFLLSAIVAMFLFVLFHFGYRDGQVPVPPLGKFFSPFTGFWQNGTQDDAVPSELALPGLRQPVIVVWDDRRVPHIFAQNIPDLYMAQGYITARDRLWQMEFQTHAAAGRLAEIFGPRLVQHDLVRRRSGMVFAAENSLKAMKKDPEVMEVVEAYTAGINAFIAALDDRNMPFEYKLFDYEPEPWTPLKSALLLKYMSWDLTGRSTDRAMTRTRKAFGAEQMRALYPLFPPFQDPIIPPGTPWDFTPKAIDIPEIDFEPSVSASIELPLPDRRNGSNNWAVAGKKTASGHPILASDPHLLLRLPSIWYEMQLSAPGVNVYGVTLPGSPAVTIGFNDHIAWGMTNAGSDVLDWYEIRFKDATFGEYWHDGTWKPTTARIEQIRVRGGETVRDTVFYTHHGPVFDRWRAVDIPARKVPAVERGHGLSLNSMFVPGAAMRWVAHDPSNELRTFLELNRAKNYDDAVQALKWFDSPAQNVAFADVAGDIAIWHNGKFPLRWPEQGRYICDGSDPRFDWREWIPKAYNPHVKNPPRGFISSANQNPADETYPYYLGWNYASFTRGHRINERLAEMESITPQDMIDLQNDCLNLTARTVLPALISHVAAQILTDAELEVLNVLKSWNYENKRELIAPTIFETWWEKLYRLIWEDDIVRDSGNLQWPRSDVTMAMILQEPENRFFDLSVTGEKKETIADLAFRSFRETREELEKRFGPMGKAWAWGTARGTDINHLAQIPGMGRMGLQTNGNAGIVNATGQNHGPSWRMVVELDPAGVKAWGVYPGGQSGNPGSIYYDNMVEDWVEGRAYKLLFLHSPDEEHEKIIGKTVLRGGGE